MEVRNGDLAWREDKREDQGEYVESLFEEDELFWLWFLFPEKGSLIPGMK